MNKERVILVLLLVIEAIVFILFALKVNWFLGAIATIFAFALFFIHANELRMVSITKPTWLMLPSLLTSLISGIAVAGLLMSVNLEPGLASAIAGSVFMISFAIRLVAYFGNRLFTKGG